MPEPRHCPECQAEIPAGAPAELCPKCLLKAGLLSEPTASSPRPSGDRFVPPALEELSARLPQLEILELLGQGGMGAVYKARQRGLDRLVAVKILPPEISRDPAFAERFSREARALAMLSHQHIVTIHDFGQADGLFYFVMEYVDGVDLRQAMQSGKITSKDALSIVTQVCDALQFAHDEGVVHRDIKPANILIDKRGRVKIADFGLAKLLGQHQADHDLTGTQEVMGTLRYMAPEQMKGSRAVDHRADIYSLGVVFYELLTGELPIGRFAPPSKRVEVDVRLDDVVLRALETEPTLRYQQASQVKTDVDTISLTMPAPTIAASQESGKITEKLDPAVLERLVLPLLPARLLDAQKLYMAKSGSGALEAFMAIRAIMRKHGIALPATPMWKIAVGIGTLALFVAIAIFAMSWWRFVSPIVYLPVLALAIIWCGIEAWRFPGTPRGGVARFALAMILAFSVLVPLLNLLASPEPLLDRIYEQTGITPGRYDAEFLQAIHLAIMFWLLSPLLLLLFKMSKTRLKERSQLKSAEWVRAPAGWLLETGIVQVLTSFIWMPMSLQDELYWLTALSALGVFQGTVVIIGAMRMWRLASYQWARLACYLAMAPSVGFGWIQGIPIGIWALRTLQKPDVRIAYLMARPISYQ
ncbi:MAG TPA: serine/threonine-protein kinase [Gemmataceae bacterium]|nr:serine/threonine-protein kinase [Gemmataceae bacterium]